MKGLTAMVYMTLNITFMYSGHKC